MFRNNVKTVILLTALAALFLGVGSLFGSGGLVIGLILGLVFVGGSYWFSDKIAVRAAGAVPVSEADAPQLYAIVRDLTARSDMPMPAIYISPAAQPNAFATGRNEHHAAVAVTQGLMQVVDQEELRGVLAHEISHVRNHDILIGSVAAAVALGITFSARMLMWGAIFGGMGGGGRDRDGNFLGAIAMMILAPIAAALLQMSLSRSREFEADRSGADLLGTGEPLARALTRIEEAAKATPMQVNPSQAYAWIHNPLSELRQDRRQGGPDLRKLFSTHPPTEARIRRLRAMRVR
jgi:heat shock protein HtpX